jgi:hypothetical protein
VNYKFYVQNVIVIKDKLNVIMDLKVWCFVLWSVLGVLCCGFALLWLKVLLCNILGLKFVLRYGLRMLLVHVSFRS